MKYVSLDIETEDPYLKTIGAQKSRGASWVFDTGRVLVTGIFDGKTKKAVDGAGGKRVANYFTSGGYTIIGANIQYDAGWQLYAHKIDVKNVICKFIDVSIVESLIDEYQHYSLDALAKKYLGESKGGGKITAIAASHGLVGDFRKHLGVLWDKGYKEEIREYVISDADQPWRIWQKQKEIIDRRNLWEAFHMNMDMILPVLSMKQHGVRFDYAKWKVNCLIADNAYNELKTDYESKYGAVNINSPKQLAVQLDRFDVPYKFKITVKGYKITGRKYKNSLDNFTGNDLYKQKKILKSFVPMIQLIKGKLVFFVTKQYVPRTLAQLSKMGYEAIANPSVNKAFFKEFKHQYEIVKDLEQYKQVKNILTKFLGEEFGRFIVRHGDGNYRIHPDFNIVGARQTGRLSGKNPNLQQVPSKTVVFEGTDKEIDFSKLCRECFIADSGCAFIKLDYASQENRITAYFAPGKVGKIIRKMYCDNPYLDEHQYAADVSGLIEEHGAKAGRKYAKNLRFGLSYGMGILTMTTQFGWNKAFANELKLKVLTAAPWLKELMDLVQVVVKKRRYITTLAGRQIHLRKGRDNEAYKFMNYLIQGSASDMTKQATVAIYEPLTLEELVLTVHDENDFSIPLTEAGIKRTMELKHLMETSSKVDIPIISNPEIGTNWSNGIEWEPALGDCEEFVRNAFKAILKGTFDTFSKNVKQYLKDKDNLTENYIEFCDNIEIEEEEEAIVF